MKQLQERDSRWRSARWKGQGWVQRVGVAALFDRPLRRCIELNAKIKKQRAPMRRSAENPQQKNSFAHSKKLFLCGVLPPVYVARRAEELSMER